MTSASSEIAPWGKWDRIALQILFAGGAVVMVLILVTGVIGLVGDLTQGTRFLELPVNHSLPAEASADSGTATLESAVYESATVAVSGLTPFTAALLTVGRALVVLTNLLVAATFVYLAWRLLRREPFLRSLTWSFIAAGATLLIGSLVGQAIMGIGANLVSVELGEFWGDSAVFVFDATPIGLAFILMLVGCAFEYAQKLSRETAGLV
jgi:hypothetical protein